MVQTNEELMGMMQPTDSLMMATLTTPNREDLAPFITESLTPALSDVLVFCDINGSDRFVGIYTTALAVDFDGKVLNEDKGVVESPSGSMSLLAEADEIPVEEVDAGLLEQLIRTNRTVEYRIKRDQDLREAGHKNKPAPRLFSLRSRIAPIPERWDVV